MEPDQNEEQEALFEIEGPDEDECVWLHVKDGPTVNLGPRDKVAEKWCDWLEEIDFGE